MEGLEKAFLFKIGIYTYHHGNIQNCTYIWKIDSNVLDSEMINKHYSIREDLKKQLQVFHTRAMQKEFLDLTNEFDGLMRILNFSIAFANQMQMEEDKKNIAAADVASQKNGQKDVDESKEEENYGEEVVDE